jgi:hypothetical protein
MSDEIRDVTTITFSGPRFDAPPLWQSVVDLGASLPIEDWDRVPTDLAANLDHYLYGTVDDFHALPDSVKHTHPE